MIYARTGVCLDLHPRVSPGWKATRFAHQENLWGFRLQKGVVFALGTRFSLVFPRFLIVSRRRAGSRARIVVLVQVLVAVAWMGHDLFPELKVCGGG